MIRLLCDTLVVLLVLGCVARAADYYVSMDGSDLNDGSFGFPYATLKKAIQSAGPGDTVYVRGGTYREEVYVNRGGGSPERKLVIRGYQNERPMIKGSDLVTGWENHQGAIWKKTGWMVNSQQVFCDDTYLQQIGLPAPQYESWQYKPVGSGLGDMYPGSFFYDSSTTTLYVWLKEDRDPNDAMMEVSTRPRVLYIDIPFVHVIGFDVRHSNSSRSGAVGIAALVGDDSIIEDCDIQWCDFEGLEIRHRSMALNCNVSNNGDVGIGAGGVRDFVVRRCMINGNNYRNFVPHYHAGGMKIVGNAYGLVEECEVANNLGNAIWFDGCASGNSIVIRGNRVKNNLKTGIFVEISSHAEVYNNLVVGNCERGIYISASNHASVFHNTLVDNSGLSAIALAGVPRVGATLKNNTVLNNLIFGTTSAIDLLIEGDNGGDTSGNASDYNCIYRPNGGIRFNSSGKNYWSLEDWHAGTGFDGNSLSENPEFTLADSEDYSTPPESPVVDRGIDCGITEDYRGLPRPQGETVDIGAFETSWRDREPPSAPANLSATAVDWNGFQLQWEPATDNVGIARYEVYRDGVYHGSTPERSFLDLGLEARRTYQYFVLAQDEAGLLSPMSNVFEVNTGSPPDFESPTAPTRLRLVVKSKSAIALEWDPSWDNVGVTKYCVWRDGSRIAFVNSTWFTDDRLTKKLLSEYTVSAFDAAGNESEQSRGKVIRISP